MEDSIHYIIKSERLERESVARHIMQEYRNKEYIGIDFSNVEYISYEAVQVFADNNEILSNDIVGVVHDQPRKMFEQYDDTVIDQ